MKIRSITAAAARAWLPQRKKDSHKGDNGRVLIVAGSRGMVGAGVLSAWGAVRSGSGLVRLGIVASQQTVAAKRGPLEATTQALPESSSGALSKKALTIIARTVRSFHPHVVAAGPGLRNTPEVAAVIKNFLRDRLPLVLDADGLNTWAEHRAWPLGPAARIITPHEGELARLLSRTIKNIHKDREGAALKAARERKSICLLKGPGTLVTDGNEMWKNTTGNPAMATGGMGDVLTGLIAGLWGQMPMRDAAAGLRAACLGAYLHGLAGDLAVKRLKTRSLLASDLVDFLPAAIKQLSGGR